jgi:hypothetical protein
MAVGAAAGTGATAGPEPTEDELGLGVEVGVGLDAGAGLEAAMADDAVRVRANVAKAAVAARTLLGFRRSALIDRSTGRTDWPPTTDHPDHPQMVTAPSRLPE